MKNNKNIESHVALFMGKTVDDRGVPVPPSTFPAVLGLRAVLYELEAAGHEDLARKEAKKILLTPGLLPVVSQYLSAGRGLSRQAGELLIDILDTYAPEQLAKTPEGVALLRLAKQRPLTPPNRASGAVGRCGTGARIAPRV